jgi:hypothetical protein
MAFEVIQEEVYRENILEKGKRADGRGPADFVKSPVKLEFFPAFMDPRSLPVEKPSHLVLSVHLVPAVMCRIWTD